MHFRRGTAVLAVAALLGLPLAGLRAGPRQSADYAVFTDSADAGGRRATAAAAGYTLDASVGGVATGVSNVLAPAETLRAGFVAQLYEVTGFALASASAALNENASLPLNGRLTLDDATALAVPAASVAWSVQSGPLTGVSAAGVATAGPVYQDTAAVVRGDFGGRSALLALTVLDSNPDNFGAYAGDGIDDSWQVQYFGPPPNPLAAPDADADGDGLSNRFEFLAGLLPTDARSRFAQQVAAVPGQPGQRRITFSPVVAGRTYTVLTRTDLLSGAWQPLTSSSVQDNGAERTVTDLAASGPRRFYQVQITKP